MLKILIDKESVDVDIEFEKMTYKAFIEYLHKLAEDFDREIMSII